MLATERITITLPSEALDIVRARVASGAAASESEAIAEALLDTILPRHDGPSEIFLQECARRYDAMRANPSRGLTTEQAFSFLADEE